MKLNVSTICFIIFIFSKDISAQAGKNISVLFIGNSYTYTNNLPQMVQQIGYTMGDSIFVDSYTPGGYFLLQHSQDSNTINKINQQPWDYVVAAGPKSAPVFRAGIC